MCELGLAYHANFGPSPNRNGMIAIREKDQVRPAFHRVYDANPLSQHLEHLKVLYSVVCCIILSSI